MLVRSWQCVQFLDRKEELLYDQPWSQKENTLVRSNPRQRRQFLIAVVEAVKNKPIKQSINKSVDSGNRVDPQGIDTTDFPNNDLVK